MKNGHLKQDNPAAAQSFVETETVELKTKYTEAIAKEFVAFLNTKGGTVYLGVADDGCVVGIANLDETMRKLSDTITSQILPSAQALIDLSAVMIDGKWIVKAVVQKGSSLYYVKKYGRSEAGCFERIGTTAKSLTEAEIERRYQGNSIYFF